MKRTKIFYLIDLKNPNNDVYQRINTYVDEKQISSELENELSSIETYRTFSTAVLDYMIRNDLETRDLYKRAFISRKLYSKIVRERNYHPTKTTVLAFCIAFELSYSEAVELLSLASYSFSMNSALDVIIKYFLRKRIYDVNIINDMLCEYDCPTIGAQK